jgi:hypothetical protein
MTGRCRRALGTTILAAFVGAAVTAGAAEEQNRQAQPRPAPAQESRKPPPPDARRSPPPSPPARAVPHPPTHPPALRPHAQARPEVRPYLYPYYPLFDFDLVYQFPYGVYPYWRYGYPYPPYEAPLPRPGCVADETQEHGSLKLAVPQKDATVFVDGFYVGVVENFDGALEHLNLTPGPHRVEIRAPGFQTLTFDVNLQPGQSITYRGALQAEPLASRE